MLANGTKALFLDNLSCLFSGVKENDADAWEGVLPWLLTLRRHRIAVVLVHHSGRNKENMRGTSRREDAAFWVIRLDESHPPPPLEWSITTVSDGNVAIGTREASSMDVFRQWIEDGLTSAQDIACEMGVSKGHRVKDGETGD